MMQETEFPEIDQRVFRETLAQFPTGVVVITAVVDGEPTGMVVGSFTSVSLDPPLVAFLPAKSSQTYQKLKKATKYCVNVLSVEQETACRVFASKSTNKFAEVDWELSESGVPKLSDALAWIEFLKTDTFDAGDHDIVLGRVISLESGDKISPLLFFQGGYGGFRSRSRVAPFAQDLREQLQYADAARQTLDELSDELGFECFAQAIVDGDITIVAGSGGTQGVRMQIGRRMPLMAPYGSIFIAEEIDPGVFLGWLRGFAGSEEAKQEYAGLVQRVRERGWSIALQAPSHEAVWARVSEVTEVAPTPVVERELSALLDEVRPFYDPEDIDPDKYYDPRLLSAPVIKDGKAVLGLALFGLPKSVKGSTIIAWAEKLKAAAGDVSKSLEAFAS